MRLPLVLGTLWFLACTFAAYRLFAPPPPGSITLQRGAVPLPARAAPAHLPSGQTLPTWTAPQPIEPEPYAPVPPVVQPTAPAYIPPPALQPAAPNLVTPLQPEAPIPPAGTPAPDLAGVCLTCGERADSWVEVDGRRQGYCPRHVSKVRVPLTPARPT